MAAPTFVESVQVTGSSTDSVTSGTIQGGTNRTYIAIFGSRGADFDVSSITGGGLTWTEEVNQLSYREQVRIWCYVAQGSPSDFTLTFTIGGTETTLNGLIISYDGANTSDAIIDAFGQNTDGENGSTNSGAASSNDNTVDDITGSSTIDDSIHIVGINVRGNGFSGASIDAAYSEVDTLADSGGDGVEIAVYSNVTETAGNTTWSGDTFSDVDWAAVSVILQATTDQSASLAAVIASGEATFTHSVSATYDATPPAIASGEVTFTHSVTFGPLEPPAIASGEATFTHSASPSTTLTPLAIASGEVAFVHSVTTTYNIDGAFKVSDGLIRSPVVTVGPVTLAPPVITSGETLFDPGVEFGPLSAPAIASGEATFTHSVGFVLSIGAVIPTAENTTFEHAVDEGPRDIDPPVTGQDPIVYAPTVSPGSVALTPPVIGTGAATFAPRAAITLSPPLIGTGEVTFAHSVTTGEVALTPPAIGTGAATFAPQVNLSLVAPIIPTGEAALTPLAGPPGATPERIPTGEATFAPSALVGAVTLTPPRIASAVTLYTSNVTTGPVTLEPPSISSGEDIGVHILTPGSVGVEPPLIGSAAQVFAPTVAYLITPGVLTGTQVVYPLQVTVGAVDIAPVSIPSGETLYAVIVQRGLVVGVITSSEALLLHAIAVGAPDESGRLVARRSSKGRLIVKRGTFVTQTMPDSAVFVGKTETIEVEIYGSDLTTLVDPSEVTIVIVDPAGVTTTDVYNAGAGNVTRDSTGVYTYELSYDQVGTWYIRWLTTGTPALVWELEPVYCHPFQSSGTI